MQVVEHAYGDCWRCNFQAQSLRTVANRRRIVPAVVAILTAFASTAVLAADEARYQVTPFGSYAISDDLEDSAGAEREVDDTLGWGIAFNLQEEGSRYYELMYSNLSTEVDGGASPLDLDIHYLQLGGTVAWPEGERVIPYFGMTIGAARLSPDQDGLDSATKFAFTVGAGVRIPITPRIGMRAEWRSYVTVVGGDADLFCKSVSGAATCLLRAESDTFLQHTAQLGVIIGF